MPLRQKKTDDFLPDFTKYSYFHVRDIAWIFLIQNKIKSYPLDLEEIACKNNWLLLAYQSNRKLFELLYPYGSSKQLQGCSCVYNHHVIIFYDDEVNSYRKRFTIAHEFGHIALMHSATKNERTYEKEANMFAARILCPLCLIKECRISTCEELSELCQISRQAAYYRLKRYHEVASREKFYTSKYEKKLHNNLRSFTKNYIRKRRERWQAMKR